MATTSATAAPVATLSKPRVAVILVVAVAIAIALNAVVATIAKAAGAPADFGGLSVPAYVSMTILGVLAGWIGWHLVERHARDPRRALTILVPVVLLLSFIPDILLAVLQFMPGATGTAILALVVMHIVVAAVAVPAYVLASRSR
ncbi:DUF6069 family protein [Leifsonia sp. Le1]|uniref:DUF6069 family protein n=1 Tax=Leifsonia sp. Le1 TaxID=3404918 RepID=UPI003EB6A83D